jgi:hypothetical protein
MEKDYQGTQKKTKGMGLFTNQELVLRLAISIIIDINEDWLTGNKYIEDLDKPLIFTNHLYTNYKHQTKFRGLSKSSII